MVQKLIKVFSSVSLKLLQNSDIASAALAAAVCYFVSSQLSIEIPFLTSLVAIATQ
jgi:hypothetical protein